tara:strand:- start:2657 stop:3772 length:1116 start_codon:yes stop_codon:yes gene_type:complete
MEEDPPDSRKQTQDLERILLKPNPNLGEIAVFNPSLNSFPVNGEIPFLYRAEIINPNTIGKKIQDLTPFDRHSVIKKKSLINPLELSSEDNTIINIGEDPRITLIGDTYYIVYTNPNAWHSSICLATTKDFKTIKKQGIIGPDMTLRKAIESVGNNFYKKMWSNHYKTKRQELQKIGKFEEQVLKVSNKDAFIHYNENMKKFILYHRFAPWAQVAIADKLEHYKSLDYWVEQLENIDNHTRIRNNNSYFSKSVGWGSPKFKLGDKDVMVYHGTDKEINYYGTFCEIKDGRIVASIQDPFLKPTNQDIFIYTDSTGHKHTKGVVFPTAALVDEPADKVYIYFGSADERIKVCSTSATGLYEQLNHPANRVAA